MDLKIKNKKADVPITIFVIMIVAICALAILSFLSSREKVQSAFEVELIEKVHVDVEKFYFYLNAGFLEEEAAEKIGAKIIDNRLIINLNKTIKSKNIISVQYTMNILK